MTQTGKVQRIDHDKIWVAVGENVPSGPGAAAACCTIGVTIVEARNNQGLNLEIGDQVRLTSDLGQAFRLGFIAVGIPLISFMTAYTGAKPWFGIDSSLGQALISLAGLAIGVAIPLAYFKFFKRGIRFPVVMTNE